MNAVPVTPQVTEYLYRKATAAGTPLSGTFELTPLCNMRCKMCYVRLTQQQQQAAGPLKTPADWLQLGKTAAEAGMLYLLLTGGEPFLYPGFRQVYEGLHRMGLLITINSNGTLIDEATVAWLKECPPVRINISLYGCDNATYGSLCGEPDGFTRTDRAIRLLQEAGISVKLSCTLTPGNAAQLPQMVAYAQQRGLVIQVASYVFPPVRRDETKTGCNFRLPAQEAAWYAAYAEYLTMGKERFLQSESLLTMPTDLEDNCADLGDGVHCRAGRCSFWVTWQGDLLPCGMFAKTAATKNVFNWDFVDAWQRVKAETAAIRLPAPCSQCPAKKSCRSCAAMVLTESGSFDRVPQYRCDMMHAYPSQWQRVKEEML